MKDLLGYVFTEIKRHFRTRKKYITIFGQRRDISRVTTIFKVMCETIGVSSTVSFVLELLK